MANVYLPQQKPGPMQQSLGFLQTANAAMNLKNQLSTNGEQGPTTAPPDVNDPNAGAMGAISRRTNRLQSPGSGGY